MSDGVIETVYTVPVIKSLEDVRCSKFVKMLVVLIDVLFITELFLGTIHP